MNKLKSRKLWVAVGAILVALVSAASGEITWAHAVNACVIAAAAYCGAEGFADGASITPKE